MLTLINRFLKRRMHLGSINSVEQRFILTRFANVEAQRQSPRYSL